MWVVRRLKALRAVEQEIINVLCAEVLSVLKFAKPAWITLVTARESSDIEYVLKTGILLVHGHRYQSFSWALTEARMTTLKDQR